MPCFDFLKGLAARYTLILVALGLCVNLLFFATSVGFGASPGSDPDVVLDRLASPFVD